MRCVLVNRTSLRKKDSTFFNSKNFENELEFEFKFNHARCERRRKILVPNVYIRNTSLNKSRVEVYFKENVRTEVERSNQSRWEFRLPSALVWLRSFHEVLSRRFIFKTTIELIVMNSENVMKTFHCLRRPSQMSYWEGCLSFYRLKFFTLKLAFLWTQNLMHCEI